MSVDLKLPFGRYLHACRTQYRAECKGIEPSVKMWIEHTDRCHEAWHDFHDPKKAKKRPNKVASREAEAIYALMPLKVGKEAALRAILGALEKVPGDVLTERVKLYASIVSRWRKEDLAYLPHPATWFNEGRWEDDPKAWERPNMLPAPGPAAPKAPAEPPGWLDFMEIHFPDWVELKRGIRPTWAALDPFTRKTVFDLIDKENKRRRALTD